uniref:WD repeat-containing protein 86-like isoform X1 n=1 Tax=Hirondellea gigas TaxID=1518452 RepID=A0A6A7FN43_9CRUS
MGSNGSKNKNSRLIETITDHEDQDINCMALSEDQSLLVTGSEDCTARMWTTKTPQTECLGIMRGHTSYITCITLSDVFVVTGAADSTIRKWDMSTCECLFVYKGHTARIYRLISTGEFIFSTSSDKTAKAWLFDKSEVLDEDNDGDDHDDDELTGKMCIRSFKGHTLAVYPIIYIPAEDEVMEDSDDEDTIVINPLDMVITGSADNTAKSWSFDTGGCLKTFKGHKAAVMSMVTDSSGKTLYTGSADKTIRSWNIHRGECLKVMEGHDGPVMCLTVINRLMYSGSQDGTARCWVREFGDCTRIYRGAKHSIVAVKVQDGILYTGSGDTCARAYDAKSGSLKKLFQGHTAGLQCLLVTKEKMYTGSSDGSLRVWNIQDLDKDDKNATEEEPADEDYEEDKENDLDWLENKIDADDKV